ncbi:unnamed protein product, partial [Staurois parvus]
LVPCDLCDHSQISHVSNDVTSDILLTTLHVITDWPISDHMIGIPSNDHGHRIAVLRAPRERAQLEMAGAVYERQPAPGVPPSCRFYKQQADGKWL